MTDRTPPAQLEELFQQARQTPTDINEHLDVLRELASHCEHVTEMGVRGGMSTIALLAAQPSTLISWDINPYSIVSQQVLNLVQLAGRTRFQPRVGDTLEIRIEPTDMLFIDTLHTGAQLKAELFRHCVGSLEDTGPLKSVRKYLAFHDTVTFGAVGEDGKEPGLRAAIHLFQKNTFPLWSVLHDRQNNNGLVVLERQT